VVEMSWDQWLLSGFSLAAIYLVTDKRPAWQRWGPVFGLCSQPFWIYTAYTHEQGGVLAMSVIYTLMWIRGIRNGFCNRS
jgi:hypothetical protein